MDQDYLKNSRLILAAVQTINKVSQEEKNCETLHFLVGNQKENQRGRRIYRVKSKEKGLKTNAARKKDRRTNGI